MVFLIHFYLRKFTIELLKRIKTFGFRCSLTKHKFPCHFFIFWQYLNQPKSYILYLTLVNTIRICKRTNNFYTQNY